MNYQEFRLTDALVKHLRNGSIRKLTRANGTTQYRREVGDTSFRADIFITLGARKKNPSNTANSAFIAIEVKVRDWRQGLYQAWKYNAFAEKSYLALYRAYAKDVDVALFRQYNVGLIVFDESAVNVLYSPRKNSFGNKYSEDLRAKLRRRLPSVECV